MSADGVVSVVQQEKLRKLFLVSSESYGIDSSIMNSL